MSEITSKLSEIRGSSLGLILESHMYPDRLAMLQRNIHRTIAK